MVSVCYGVQMNSLLDHGSAVKKAGLVTCPWGHLPSHTWSQRPKPSRHPGVIVVNDEEGSLISGS